MVRKALAVNGSRLTPLPGVAGAWPRWSAAITGSSAPWLALLLAGALGGCASFPEDESRDSPPPEIVSTPERQEPPPEEGTEDTEDLRVSAYTPPPEPVVQQYPRNISEVSGPAVVSLHAQAESERDAGRPENAVAVLERALRLEPRNAFLWSALARAQLEAGNAGQAESVALRANSFARGNPWLEARNWRTIAEARKSAGDLQGAEDARSRAQNAQMRQSQG